MVEILGNPLVWMFGGIAVSWILSAVAHYWYKAHRAQLDANLKMEMIQRGMSADDIVKVLAAQSTPRATTDDEDAAEPESSDIHAAK